ncbi:hypothetical protein [Paenibacillus amylolyticus]|uniref:Uncharacterized protein n=1 Tax=Paenibacillus amylolyticus TaxID=1451 RepID=A0ABD8B2W8_PAEAM
MWEEIEKNEAFHNATYKQINNKIEQLMAEMPEMKEELLELESWFQDINVKSQADMYIAGYTKGREMAMEEFQERSSGVKGEKTRTIGFFRRKNLLNPAK